MVRFAKALGFSGWKEFLKAFWEEQSYQEQHYTDIDANYPFDADSSRQDIINQLCSLQVESLLDTADLLGRRAPGGVRGAAAGAAGGSPCLG